MGNCQTVDAAALVIQHPNGKLERMYWSVTVRDVMKMNPGHYVSLIIPLPIPGDGKDTGEGKTVRFTRVKLLRPSDTLTLGHAYRLVTTEEVVKVIRAKKHAKMTNNGTDSSVNFELISKKRSHSLKSAPEKNDKKPEENRDESHQQIRPTSGSTNLVGARPKSWRPSLQSISESGS